MRSFKRAPFLVLTVLALAGCGSASSPASRSGSGSAGTPGTVHVGMKGLFFSPSAVHARPGDRVVWTNNDSSPHNVTYVSGPLFTSSRRVLRPGTRFSIELTAPGTIHYLCSIHPWMKATITVSQ